jgi:hypothetical protein
LTYNFIIRFEGDACYGLDHANTLLFSCTMESNSSLTDKESS